MADVKLSKQQALKQQVVESIQEKVRKSKSVVLTEFKGLTVVEDSKLRAEFRKNDIEYKVLKNTLIKRAFNELGYTEFDSSLNGTTSVAFSYKDEVAAAKIITENSKKLNNKLTAKCGLVSGQFIGPDGIKELSSLPGKDVLIAKMLGSFNAPITNFAGVLNATLRGLVLALNAVSEKKAQA